MNKNNDLRFIKRFSKISISGICKDLNINRSNLMNGRASNTNTAAVKTEIKKKIKELEEE